MSVTQSETISKKQAISTNIPYKSKKKRIRQSQKKVERKNKKARPDDAKNQNEEESSLMSVDTESSSENQVESAPMSVDPESSSENGELSASTSVDPECDASLDKQQSLDSNPNNIEVCCDDPDCENEIHHHDEDVTSLYKNLKTSFNYEDFKSPVEYIAKIYWEYCLPVNWFDCEDPSLTTLPADDQESSISNDATSNADGEDNATSDADEEIEANDETLTDDVWYSCEDSGLPADNNNDDNADQEKYDQAKLKLRNLLAQVSLKKSKSKKSKEKENGTVGTTLPAYELVIARLTANAQYCIGKFLIF